MVEPNYQNLPAPQGYVIDLEKMELWDYRSKSDDPDEPAPRLNLAFNTPTMDIWLVEIPSGLMLPWHTHEPHTSQVYWLLQGEIKVNYKDSKGEPHSYVGKANDEELIFLPAGAHNQIESVGDETLRFLSIKEGGGAVNGRLDHIFGDVDKHYDPNVDPLPAGLDILPTRGKVLEKQDDIVTEY